MRVSCCAQEHNIETWVELEPTRSPVHRAYIHYKKRKKKTTTITTEWNEIMKEKQKMKKSCSLLRASAGS